MILVSEEFEEALQKELKRVEDEVVDDFMESEEVLMRIDAEVKKQLDDIHAFFAYKSDSERLALYVSTNGGFVTKNYDLEDVLETEIKLNESDHLEHILERLEAMVNRIKRAI